MKHKVLLITFVCVCVGIGVLSLMPPRSGVELGESDKIGHFIAYGVLSLNWAMLPSSRRMLWLGMMGCCLYGLVMEAGQGFVPGRDPSWADALANTGGIAIGCCFALLRAKTSA